MASQEAEDTALSSLTTAAVLKPSEELPKGSQKVEELDFNAYNGRPVTVEELIEGMKHMGFQASSIGEAVRIINEMVCIESEQTSIGCIPILQSYYMLISNANNQSESLARS
jgi:deoxyhypusine synthase